MRLRDRLRDESGSGWTLFVEIFGVITGVLALWEFGARVNIVPGPSPIQFGTEVVEEWPNLSDLDVDTSPPPELDIPDGDDVELARPSGLVVVDPDCSAPKLSWNEVEGATNYMVTRDGSPAPSGMTSDTSITLQTFPDGQTHQYRVIATAFGVRSEASEPVDVNHC